MAIMIWGAKKGAQLQDPSGRGCAWYAGQNVYYSRARCRLFAGSPTEAVHLLADKGHHCNSLADSVQQAGINPVIPPCKSRKNLRYYDKYLYRLRHLIGNPFLELKC